MRWEFDYMFNIGMLSGNCLLYCTSCCWYGWGISSCFNILLISCYNHVGSCFMMLDHDQIIWCHVLTKQNHIITMWDYFMKCRTMFQWCGTMSLIFIYIFQSVAMLQLDLDKHHNWKIIPVDLFATCQKRIPDEFARRLCSWECLN